MRTEASAGSARPACTAPKRLALVNSLLKTGLWGPSKSGARPLNRHESALSAADYDRIAAVLW